MRIERIEREAIIEAALEKLATEHRPAILWKDFRESLHKEIGVPLNMPLGTVRSRIPRAPLELREHLLLLAEWTDKRLLKAAENMVDG